MDFILCFWLNKTRDASNGVFLTSLLIENLCLRVFALKLEKRTKTEKIKKIECFKTFERQARKRSLQQMLLVLDLFLARKSHRA